MKTFKYALVALVATSAVAGPVFAQTAQTAKPATPAPAAAKEAAKAAPKTLAGELVAFDQTAKTATVKHMVDKKPMQVTFSVDDSVVASLAHLKPGDPVKVTYVEMGEKRIIKSIVKA
jgi:Cu/Ag efflux protein CusF